jgi:hypothetical protein
MPTARNRLEYHGELMENYAGQVPVEGGKAFRTLLDAKEHPLIFGIGSDSRLRLICRNYDDSDPEQSDSGQENGGVGRPASDAPWRLTSLTAGPVHSFAVAQNPDNREIRIAYSTFEGNQSRLYYSRLKGNDHTKLKTAADFEWVEHHLDNPADEINTIDIDYEYMMFSTRSASDGAFYYAARFDEEHTRFELPEDGSVITDFKVGSYSGTRGTYLLYDIGRTQDLVFQGFPGTDPDQPVLHKRYALHGNVSSIELIRRAGGKDHLLACGDALLLYESDKVSHLLIADRNSTFSGIRTSQHDGSSSIWVVETIDQQGALLFLTDRFFDDAQQVFERKWTADMPFMADVRAFSCTQGASGGNHLIAIDAANQLTHLYQDPSTTLWRQDAIAVESLNEIVASPCYTTRFLLRGEENGMPVTGERCYISSSSGVSATINGVAYRLSSGSPVPVKTDIMGAVTIIIPVDDEINAPIFYVGYEKDRPSFILNPAHKVEERLAEIHGAADFRKALTDEGPEGRSLWDDPGDAPGNDDLAEAADIIQHLLRCKTGMLNDELAKLPGGRAVEAPSDDIWGVLFENGRMKCLNSTQAQDLVDEDARKGLHPIRWIGHSIGSLFHRIKSAFGDLKSFVVRKVNAVTTFILNFAGEVFHFVIDTLEKVFPFLKAVFHAIKVVFTKLLHWLGRLLGWNDIWYTHKVIARLTRNGTKSIEGHVERSVEGWKASVHDYVQGLQDELARITERDLPEDSEKGTVARTLTSLLVSPVFSWPMYTLLHKGILKRTYDFTIGKIAALDDFARKQAGIYDYVADFVHEEIGAILEFAAAPGFSSRKMFRLFELILTRILTTVDELIRGLLEFVVDALKQLERLCDDTVEIPFLSPLYAFVTRLLGEEEPFSFLNGFALMLSVPFTTFYKVFMKGKKPFQPPMDGFGEPEMFERLWKAPQNDGAPAENPGGWDQLVVEYQTMGGLLGAVTAFATSAFAFAGDKDEGAAPIVSMLNGITHAATLPVTTAEGLDTPAKQAAYGLRLSQFVLSVLAAHVVPDLDRYKSGDAAREKAKNIMDMVISTAGLGTNVAANVLSNPGPLNWTSHMFCRAGSLVLGSGQLAKQAEVIFAGMALDMVGSACGAVSAAVYGSGHVPGTYT